LECSGLTELSFAALRLSFKTQGVRSTGRLAPDCALKGKAKPKRRQAANPVKLAVSFIPISEGMRKMSSV
jgi:hypothetical protein